MDTLLLYFYTSLPWIVVLALALMIVAGAGVGMVWPRFLVYGYMAVFFFKNSTSYGSVAMFETVNIYSRGSGVLYFPLLLCLMLGAWLCARVSPSFQRYPAPPLTCSRWSRASARRCGPQSTGPRCAQPPPAWCCPTAAPRGSASCWPSWLS